MKILFITFSPLSSKAGHVSRLGALLSELSRDNEITILCLSDQLEIEGTVKQHRTVKFINHPIKFNGWQVVGLSKVVDFVRKFAEDAQIDVVVLMMEVWDLIRELNKSLSEVKTFATVVHAMPFLTSPVSPTKDFEGDVHEKLLSNIDPYKKRYIVNHYHEAPEVLGKTNIIAQNKTVYFYLKNYFPNVRVYQLETDVRMVKNQTSKNYKRPEYDFIYMARMESGKGLEYLPTILNLISKRLGRKVTITIAGKTTDKVSKKQLHKLIRSPNQSDYEAKFVGWINERQKDAIMPRAGVFLYPSHLDNHPIVVGEALAFGLPVVMWDIPAAQLNYGEVEAVRVVPLMDYSRFAREAVFALENRAMLAKSGIKLCASYPSASEVAKMDLALLRTIIRSQAI